ncbi:MAG: hypothetical protein ACM3XM_17230 [Mycobacterium leprae]
MKAKTTLENLEAAVGRSLTEAFFPVQAPPEMVDRIRHQLLKTPPVRRTALARILPFPHRVSLHPTHRPLRRWVAAAVAAMLLLAVGGPGVQYAGRRWLGPQASFPIAAPFPLSGIALAATPSAPALVQQMDPGLRYRLVAPLPALPATGLIQSVQLPNDAALLQSVKKGLGVAAPIQTEWDKIPFITPKTGHRMGPFLLGVNSRWWYDAGTSPTPASASSPADYGQARTVAEAWLKQAHLYPSGPLDVTAEQNRGGLIEIAFYPAAGSPLAAGGDYPGIRVGVWDGRVTSALGLWPDQVTDLTSVPLRSAAEAWADLQAGIGVISPERPELIEPAPDPTMTIREVRLDRALVQSLDKHWYFIPVVLFRGDVMGADGKPHEQLVYVSAVKPQPGQGGYELKVALPEGPAAAPALHVTKPTPETIISGSYRPDPQPKTFLVPSNANAIAAARRIAEASAFADQPMGAPVLVRSPLDVSVSFPILSSGLPIIRSGGTPSFGREVSVNFRAPGSVASISLFSFPAEPVGDPLPLITAAEAWDRLRSGSGWVKIINTADEFPNAQFAAHRTVIDQVVMAYDMDVSVEMDRKSIIEPAWFFYGKAEVGEDHRQVKIVAIVPARR